MKKFQPIGGSPASVLLLLILSAMITLAITWNEPILAQSASTDPNAPTDTPIPVRVDDRNNNLWWLLILIPVGGAIWALSRSRRQNPEIDATIVPPIVPNIPVSSVDPAMLDGRATQSNGADANSLVERDRQRASSLADREPVTLESTNGNGRDRELEVTNLPAAPVNLDERSTQSRIVSEKTSAMPLTPAPEPDRHLTERIQLLGERLVVDRHKRKVGEITVRKEIETRLVSVPIRREILIVEQVEPDFKQLAVVDLGQIHDDATANDPRLESSSTIAANFSSPAAAIEFLKSIAARSSSASPALQLKIVLEDADTQAVYRQWLDRRSVEAN